MKRIGLIVGVFAAGIAAIVLVTPWLAPEAGIRLAVSRQIEALTGRVPVIDGHARFSLLPFPSVTVDGISIPSSDGKAPLLVADSFEGTLRLPAFLLGRVELASVALTRPRLDLRSDREGQRSWSFSSGALAELASGRDVRLPLFSLRVVDGSLHYRNEGNGRDVTVKVEDAALNWVRMSDAMSASGIIGWKGQTIDLAMTVSDPGLLLSGSGSDIRGTLSSDIFRVSAAGILTADGRFEGKIGASAPSLRDVLRWADIGIGDGKSLGAFKLKSPATIDVHAMAFPVVQLEMDGNSAEGALALKLDGTRPKLTGTLAAETLDMTPYVDELDLVEGPMRRWRNDAISLETLDAADVDLRISAAETTLGNAHLGRTAAGAVAHDGTLELSLGEAAAYGGTINGRMSLLRKDGRPQMAASVEFDDLDLYRALGDVFAFRKFEGTGHGTIEVAADGNTVADLLRSLNGEARFAVDGGALVGVDLVDVMRQIEKRPLNVGYEPRSGRTAFDKASASFVIKDGIARTSDARLDGTSLSVEVGGATGIAARNFDLAGEAVLAPSDTAPDPFHLPFKIMGSWEWPVVEPDADALIRRSGAAAPLLKHGESAFTAEGAAKPTATVPVGHALAP
jgi:AsmA protein